MHVTRIAQAVPYEAPGHHGMHCLRIQGREAGPSEVLWMAVSHLLPGRHIEMSASPQEKMYVCLAGEVTVRTDREEVTLAPLDSVRLAPGEARALENRTKLPATVLLAMPEAPNPPTVVRQGLRRKAAPKRRRTQP